MDSPQWEPSKTQRVMSTMPIDASASPNPAWSGAQAACPALLGAGAPAVERGHLSVSCRSCGVKTPPSSFGRYSEMVLGTSMVHCDGTQLHVLTLGLDQEDI